MRAVAGVDVGNSTTEVVLADAGTDPPRPLAWDRAPTRGRKGSPQAAAGAAALVARLARRSGLAPALVAVAPQRPVDTLTAVVPRTPPATGDLLVLAARARTPGRPGAGSGLPVDVTAPPAVGDGPVVLLVPLRVGYAEAARLVAGWDRAGAQVAGVLVEADEGVLIARRCALDVPVLDGVPVGRAEGADLVAVEVAAPGRPLRLLADPVRLRALAGAPGPDAAAVASALADAGCAAVAVRPAGAAAAPSVPDAWVGDAGGGRLALGEAVDAVRAAAPGAFRALALPGRVLHPLDDLWLADLEAAAADVEARRSADRTLGIVAAALAPNDAAAAAATRRVLEEALGVPVVAVPAETAAARAGALSTPGADPGAVVLDLGGGTVDAVAAGGRSVVVAGAGELVTSAVAAVLGIPRGAADWVKRGPSSRREGPHLLLGEDGSRVFTDVAAPAESVGSLVVPGPAGLLPFARDLAPSEWRALRLHLKRVTLGENVARCLRLLGGDVREVLLVGGAAGDEEVLRVLDRVAPGALVGRADVAGGAAPGALGHRWAVAYGAVLLTTPSSPRDHAIRVDHENDGDRA
ncbi:MAG TPA: diol dehydratase reactivase ATPase-like domain-containing protein [Kineosporiaceae bacterium]|nr:diol dehydratase reactivase ATPase-like domain-containing protein [Kineosporiaceae bacterium]